GGDARGHAGFAAHAHGQRHPDRDRRWAGEVADGPHARPQVIATTDLRSFATPPRDRNSAHSRASGNPEVWVPAFAGTNGKKLTEQVRDHATLTRLGAGSLLVRNRNERNLTTWSTA